jgi:hypothetical protein
MSNDKKNEFAGELLPPEVIRKGVYELGKVDRVPPEVGIFDSPTRCFVVNVEWWSHIAGMVHLLADVVSWKDAEDESYFAITEILKFMQGMECMDFALRQNPADDCILQQTTDGGTTWTDVFDFSQCVTIQDKSYQISIQNQVTNVQETFIDIYNNYTANYAGLPSDVYPALEQPAAGTDDSALKAALCNAIWELIRNACNAAVSYYTESINQSQGEANFLLAIAAFALTALALAAAVPTAGASLVALGGSAALIAGGIGLGAGLANYLVDFWQQHTIDQFQDTEAMEEVACYLVDELEAGNKSLAAMQAALVGHGLTGNAGVIADFLAILLSHDSTYAAFLDKWNNNKQYADAGIDLYCPCASEYKVWVWDFSNGMGDFTFDVAPFGSSCPGTTLGVLEDGRIKGVQCGPSSNEIAILMDFETTWRIRSVKLHLERRNGITHGVNDAERFHMIPTGGDPIIGGFRENGVIERCGVRTVTPFYWSGASQIRISLGVRYDDSPLSEIFLDKVEIMFEADYAKGGYITDDDNLCE